MRTPLTLGILTLLLAAIGAQAHDTWVQTNTNVIRRGDQVFIDLMLGNHGNDHRDFKLASKVKADAGTLDVIAPDGKKYDLKDRLADVGYTPTEGFWTSRFAPAQEGLHLIAYSSDQVASYGPVRILR